MFNLNNNIIYLIYILLKILLIFQEQYFKIAQFIDELDPPWPIWMFEFAIDARLRSCDESCDKWFILRDELLRVVFMGGKD